MNPFRKKLVAGTAIVVSIVLVSVTAAYACGVGPESGGGASSENGGIKVTNLKLSAKQVAAGKPITASVKVSSSANVTIKDFAISVRDSKKVDAPDLDFDHDENLAVNKTAKTLSHSRSYKNAGTYAVHVAYTLDGTTWINAPGIKGSFKVTGTSTGATEETADPAPVAKKPTAPAPVAKKPVVTAPKTAAPKTTAPKPTAASGKIKLGATVEPDQLDDPQFAKTLIDGKFDSLTAENAMKFGSIEPNQGQFNWDGSDKIVNFAQENNMRVRGHALVWHTANPGWVEGLSDAEAKSAMQNHITQLVGRYKGKIAQWDVVNEAFEDDGSMRDTMWKQKLGDDYIALAFQWAHAADPSAQLYYNDYGAEGMTDKYKPKADAVYKLVQTLKAKGIPIHGVGMQMHAQGPYPGTGADIANNIKRLRALGVGVEITELDVVDAEDQAARYAEIGAACKAGGCSGVTTWGLYDGHTWRSGMKPLLYDENMKAKPAYAALVKSIGR